MSAALLRRAASFASFVALRAAYWRQSRRRRAARLLLFTAYLYVGILLVLLGLENRFLFYPTPAAVDWDDPPPGLTVEDVDLTSANGTRLHAWWTAPRGWSPADGA